MNLASYIEHTNLSPTLTGDDVEKLVEQALAYQFVGVCVPPFWVRKAKRDVDKASTAVVTVIGFPLGYQRTETKLHEIKLALQDGADELDLVINVSAIKHNAFEWIKPEILRCAQLIHEQEKILKVILETAYLTDEEIVRASKVCADAGADYIKTSTGFAPAGATIEHVQLMRASVPETVGIKASGGIRTLEKALAMIQAGADRLGTSSGVALIQEINKQAHS
jgi:deoxyribose-phosphate aldolase